MYLDRLREQIEKATALVNAAAFEYRMANESQAADLHLQAETVCAEIVGAVGELTEEEADLVEPRITELEQRLFTLPKLHYFSPG